MKRVSKATISFVRPLGVSALCLFLLSNTAFASTQVLIWSGNPSNSAPTFFTYVNAFTGGPRAGALANLSSIAAAAGTFRGLTAAATAPGGSASLQINILKNGVSQTPTCTITGAATSCTDTTNSFSVAAGDSIEMEVTPATTPTVNVVSVALNFTPTTANVTLLPAAQDFTQPSASVPNYTALGYSRPTWDTAIASSTGGSDQTIFPDAGKIGNLYYNNNGTAVGAGKSLIVIFYKNALGTSLSCTISATATCNDTTHSINVSTNDLLNYTTVPSGTPTTDAAGYGMTFTPNRAGDFIFFGGNWVAGAGNQFQTFAGGSGSATEANVQMVTNAMTIKGFVTMSAATPGGANTRTYTLRKNGSDTALTCTQSSAQTQCTATGSVAVNDGDLIDYSMTGAGNATFTEVATLANISTPIRTIRLFEGFKIKLISNKIKIFPIQ